jgi:hypothetical protein
MRVGARCCWPSARRCSRDTADSTDPGAQAATGQTTPLALVQTGGCSRSKVKLTSSRVVAPKCFRGIPVNEVFRSSRFRFSTR